LAMQVLDTQFLHSRLWKTGVLCLYPTFWWWDWGFCLY